MNRQLRTVVVVVQVCHPERELSISVAVTVYPDRVDPFAAGEFHVTVALSLPATATGAVGVVGSPIGRNVPDTEAGEVPPELVAVTTTV